MDAWLTMWADILANITNVQFGLIVGFLGLFLGSFYNVCIDRTISGESLSWPPSHCTACGGRLRFWELIPVVSWVMLGGKCARCKTKLSLAYPLVEILTAVILGLVAWRFGPSRAFAVYFVFSSLYLIASGIDARICILPDVITLGCAAVAPFVAIFVLNQPWESVVAGGLIGAGVFWLLGEIYRRRTGVDGMGLGDVKLMLSIGFLCGVAQLPLVVLVAAVAALIAFIMAKLCGKDIAQLRMPFGPFLCAAAWVSWMAGHEIVVMWVAFVTGR